MAKDPFEEFQQRLLSTQDEARDEAVKSGTDVEGALPGKTCMIS